MRSGSTLILTETGNSQPIRPLTCRTKSRTVSGFRSSAHPIPSWNAQLCGHPNIDNISLSKEEADDYEPQFRSIPSTQGLTSSAASASCTPSFAANCMMSDPRTLRPLPGVFALRSIESSNSIGLTLDVDGGM